MLDVQTGPTKRGRSFISAALAACAGARSARLGLRLLQPGRWGAPGSLPTSGWERAAGTRGLGGGSCGCIAGLLLPSGGTSGGSRQWLRSASNREAALGPWSPGLFTRGIVTRTSACSAATRRRAPGSACEAPNGIDEAGRGMGGDDGRLGQRAEQRRSGHTIPSRPSPPGALAGTEQGFPVLPAAPSCTLRPPGLGKGGREGPHRPTCLSVDAAQLQPK